MTFVCQCCGDCCSTMGEIISIRDKIHPYEFRIGYTNGEERVVSVDPDKRLLFRDQQQAKRKSIACPFLRQLASKKRICTVHASRPELCRNYLCSRILILDSEGNRAGRVRYGTMSFLPAQDTGSSGDYRVIKSRPATGKGFIPPAGGLAPGHRRIHASRRSLPYPGCISLF